MKPCLEDVLKRFNIKGEFTEAQPVNSGHINDTYVVCFKQNNNTRQRYVLQRINHYVFKEPDKLMDNIIKVTAYLRKKIESSSGNPNRETLSFIPVSSGKFLHVSEDGSYWRVYSYIEDAITYQVVENSNHFYNAGKAFGRFQMLLSDFPVDDLYETIPDFHNTPKRLKALIETIDKDINNRAINVSSEIDFVMKRAEETSIIVNLLDENKLPLRVTHNDTKFNNVLIDTNTGEGICVIDLDTVMPGTSLYDFGDSIRSGANTADEDEPDLAKVWMDIGLFEQFTRGYLEMAGGFLTPTELEYLPFSAKLITFELGMRFLMDYLNGDIYFKIHRDGHNLDRARVQFKLVSDMEAKYDKMKNIVEKYK
ncbi:MAG TPA: aminoglycoside phosphotransferase family protein [Clostridiales bacterium]|nr:aminoglycoside phosphotransferase family protein [Clostridiales bacterium]